MPIVFGFGVRINLKTAVQPWLDTGEHGFFSVQNDSVSPSFALRPSVKSMSSVQSVVKSLCSVRSFAANSGFGCGSAALRLSVV